MPAFVRPQAQPRSLVRSFIGADGREWLVRESPLPSFDRRTGQCLIFETVDAARRIRDYPENWRELSDEELSVLSEHPR